jgi:branched-chain amino acid aminotransferase
MSEAVQRPSFGSVLTTHMAVAEFRDGKWGAEDLRPVAPLSLSPAAHVLHYASTCFEGFKAFRRPMAPCRSFAWTGTSGACAKRAAAGAAGAGHGAARRHGARRDQPLPDAVPQAPGALYLRPLLIGTMANIGAASTPHPSALLIVLASPVWDYFRRHEAAAHPGR